MIYSKIKTIWFLLLLIAFFTSSCEQTVDGDLDFEERLVIYGILEAGGYIDSIYISKTLPPLQDAFAAQSYVYDAKVSIWLNGNPYNTTSDGNRYYNRSVKLNIFDTVRIDVEWKDHLATATTVVPPLPEIDYLSGYIDTRNNPWDDFPSKSLYFYAHLKSTNMDYYYLAGESWEIEQDRARYNPVAGPGEVFQDKIPLYYDSYFSIYINPWDPNPSTIDSVQQITRPFFIEAYPNEFGAYWRSRYNDNGFDGPFSVGGLNPVWNIKGGIGIFFARSVKIIDPEDYTIVTDEPN